MRVIPLRLLAPVMLCLASAAHAQQSEPKAQASFDCGLARTAIEKTICGDPELAQDDRSLADAYQAAWTAATPGARKILAQEQLNWLRLRNPNCGAAALKTWPSALDKASTNGGPVVTVGAEIRTPKACLDELYHARTKELSPPAGVPGDALSFSANGQPFMPRLVLDNDHVACRLLESVLQQDFLARHAGEVAASSAPLPPSSGIQPLPWGFDATEAFSVDIDGNGHQRTLLLISRFHHEAWDSFEAYLRDSPPDANELAGLRLAPGEALQAKGWKPIATGLGSPESPFSVIWLAGRYFLLRPGSEPLESDPHLPTWAVGLYPITTAGLGKRGCAVAVAPVLEFASPGSGRYASGGDTPPIAKVTPPPALRELLRTLEDDVDPISSCPAMRSWSVADQRMFAEYTSLARPWEYAVHAGNDGKPLQDNLIWSLAVLKRWGFDSLYNYRIYRRFVELRPQAVAEMAAFYRERFGLADAPAQDAARLAVDQNITASLELDSSSSDLQGGWEPPDTLPVAVLLGRRQKIEQASDDDLAAAAKLGTEPLLFYSLDDIGIAGLLVSKGVDVNATNWFGKTALMYAAQWNLVDVARLLLAGHADVNAATTRDVNAAKTPLGTSVCDAPRITGRTALMYAAENADAPMIEALLTGGADRHAKDSAGHDAAWHLAQNTRLAPAERARLSQVLSAAK